jgi:hypothetical protein
MSAGTGPLLMSRSVLRGGVNRLATGRWAWFAGYLTATIVLFSCYFRLSGTQPATSDGASIALQAWDMLHGNLLLHGWALADVSFYTTELPEYMLVEAFRGLGAADVHTAAALTYTLLVLLAGLVAKGRATGAEGLVRVLIAAGIMIAPQLGQGTLILLLAPDHTGTGVPLLLTWLVLDRAPRRWYTPPVIGLLLTWAMLGDRIVELLGVVPLALVCAVRVYQGTVRDKAPVRQWWFELSLLGTACAAYVLSDLAYAAIAALGGSRLEPVQVSFASAARMPGDFGRTLEGLLALYGADFFSLPWDFRAAIAIAHLVGVAMAATAVWLGLRRFLGPGFPRSEGCPRSDDLLTGVLTVGLLLNLGVYLFSTMPVSTWSTREIAGVLPAGAVLAGRLLAGPVRGARLQPVLAVVGLGYLVALAYGAAQPQLPAVTQNLAGWLSAHHLRYGLSGYGFGPVTTLASGGKVDLRQAAYRPGVASPGPEEYDLSWYDAKAHDADFLVLATTPAPPDPLTAAEARGIFGPPRHVYHYAQYVIWTYDRNLLSEVR